jgi:hypothetical protein
MSKNILLDCVHPVKAIEFLIKASNVSRRKFFKDAGFPVTSGYNFVKNTTICSDNWYNLLARIPDPFYQVYLKLITRVHTDTLLEGTLSYDPFLFNGKRDISSHPVNEVLVYLTEMYSIDTSEIAYHTGIKLNMINCYLLEGTHTPRLDRLRFVLSAFSYNIVLEFEWIMRNIHSNISLSDLKYIKSVL